MCPELVRKHTEPRRPGIHTLSLTRPVPTFQAQFVLEIVPPKLATFPSTANDHPND